MRLDIIHANAATAAAAVGAAPLLLAGMAHYNNARRRHRTENASAHKSATHPTSTRAAARCTAHAWCNHARRSLQSTRSDRWPIDLHVESAVYGLFLACSCAYVLFTHSITRCYAAPAPSPENSWHCTNWHCAL